MITLTMQCKGNAKYSTSKRIDEPGSHASNEGVVHYDKKL